MCAPERGSPPAGRGYKVAHYPPARRLAVGLVVFLLLGPGACVTGPAGAVGSRGEGAPPASGHVSLSRDTHDFGTVEAGALVHHRFVLSNDGPGPLQIRSVTPSCGCAASLVSSEWVPEGSEAEVEVRLDTLPLSGRLAKSVVVHTSDPSWPDVTLVLRGTVVSDVSASPQAVYLGRIPLGAAASQMVEVTVNRPEVAIVGVASEKGELEVSFQPLEPPRHGMRVWLTLPPAMRSGTFDDRLVVSTTSPRQPRLEIPVLGLVERRAPAWADAGRPGTTAARADLRPR